MLEIKCNKCSKKHSISEEYLGKKAKCSCGNIIEIKKISRMPNTKIISIIVGILFIITTIFYLFSKPEFEYYNGLYYTVLGDNLTNIYDKEKNILYQNVNSFFVSKDTGTYIICENEQHFLEGEEVKDITSALYDSLTADCKIYDKGHGYLDSYQLDSPILGWAKQLEDKIKEY